MYFLLPSLLCFLFSLLADCVRSSLECPRLQPRMSKSDRLARHNDDRQRGPPLCRGQGHLAVQRRRGLATLSLSLSLSRAQSGASRRRVPSHQRRVTPGVRSHRPFALVLLCRALSGAQNYRTGGKHFFCPDHRVAPAIRLLHCAPPTICAVDAHAAVK